MSANRREPLPCPSCRRLTLPIQVHGQVQCQHCGTRIDPSRGGERAQPAPTPTRAAVRVRYPGNPARAVRRQSSVKSPCTALCTLIPGTQLCAGCYRSVEEIRDWLYYDDTQKTAVVSELDARRGEWSAVAEARLARAKR